VCDYNWPKRHTLCLNLIFSLDLSLTKLPSVMSHTHGISLSSDFYLYYAMLDCVTLHYFKRESYLHVLIYFIYYFFKFYTFTFRCKIDFFISCRKRIISDDHLRQSNVSISVDMHLGRVARQIRFNACILKN